MKYRALSLLAASVLFSSAGAITTEDIIARIDFEKIAKLENQTFVVKDTNGKDLPIFVRAADFRTSAFSQFDTKGQCNLVWAGLRLCQMGRPGDITITPKEWNSVSYTPDAYDSSKFASIYTEHSLNGYDTTSPKISQTYQKSDIQYYENGIDYVDATEPSIMVSDPLFKSWPQTVSSMSSYNTQSVSVISGALDQKRPSVAQLVGWGIEIGDTYVDEGYTRTPADPGDTGGGDTGTGGGNTTPGGFEPGTGTTCWGDAGLNLWEKLLTRVFMPCVDWGKKFDDLGAKMATKKPMGYVSWLSQMGEGYYAGDSLDLCMEGDIAGKALPCFNIKKSSAGKWYEDHNIRGAFMFVFWIVVTMFFVRFATK